jgi:hypothetical protein
MREIAGNPDWAVPLEKGIPPAGKERWVPYAGKGPLEGMAVHPAVAEMLKAQTSPNAFRQALGALFGDKGANAVMSFNQGYRKALLAGPSTIANIAIGHGWFAHSEAAMAGTHFGPFEYANALRDIRTAARGGQVDPYLAEAMDRTDLLSRGASILPKAAKSVSGGVGLETPMQNAGRALKGVGTKYLNVTHDILAGGKYGLYKQLRLKGYAIDDAARMTRRATIDYTNLPKPIRFLDQGMVSPFITFTYRGAKLAGKMALNRPDIFATASGSRMNYYMDRMADRIAESRGQKPTAVAARQSGQVGPVDFALPGMTEAGQQRYAHAPLLAPLLHHFASGQDLSDIIKQPIRGVAPLAQVAYGLATNRDLRSAEVRPITPDYLPPGVSAEKAGIVGSWLAHALAPPAGKLDLFANAARGTTAYPRAELRPQTLGEAGLQYLTGTKLGTAAGLMPSAQETELTQKGVTAARKAEALPVERAAGGAQYGEFAKGYFQHLMDRIGQDPSFTPDQSLRQKAAALPPGRFHEYLTAAAGSLQSVVYGEHYTGQDREAAIRRLMDWNFALAQSAQERGMRIGPILRGMAIGIGRPLAAIQGQ